jgi:azurin
VETLPPLAYLPRALDNSCGGQAWVPDDRWGPLRGQMIHLSQGAATHHLILRQNVGGQWQGAAVPLPGDFLSGIHRARFSPRDGQLYVAGMNGWGVYAPDDGCLQRVRYTGGSMQLPVGWEACDNGVLVTFSSPLGAGAEDASRHFAQCWSYRYGQAYGSPEFSVRWPGTPGHDPLEITSAHVLNGGRSLFLEIPQLQPASQVHLFLQPEASGYREMFLTVHRLGPAFTDFPGYQFIAKAGPASSVITTATGPRANPWKDGPPGRALRLEAASGLQFATKELKARAGERLSLTFANPDAVPHNWVLLKPGTVEKTGDLANKLISDPNGFSRHYVPDTQDILAWTDMVPPAGSFTIHFNAPPMAGDYPYLCTFPGHWMLMKGVLKVE